MIQALIDRKGLNPTDLAAEMGIKPQAIYQWLSGKTEPGKKNLHRLSEIFGVPIGELMKGQLSGTTKSTEPLYQSENVKSVKSKEDEIYTYVPYLTAKAQAGIPNIVYEDCRLNWIEEEYAVILPENLKKKQSLVIDVMGDSMEPEIKNGAKVIAVHVPSNDIKYESGAVYAVLYANRFVVKRIKTNTLTTSDILTLHSDNERFGEIVVKADEIQCMWKVVAKVWEPVQ
ncbi:LexA family transcriptional regulator [Spirosoma endbachense]|uniref:Helix-turn-helix domain-containing protein n=1 Tax=Spirosoma endbachense TaxID=2666025 RepID=A0A6P1VYL4_9BACT|nr:LexA family transcriptional regulator [Spirosoma endbachense]QHV97865.1 helix-turn-helix domain-containing protein [Spirosoma endbachense]